MKISRWESNQGKKNKKPAKGHKCTSACRNRHNNWDTTGLKKQLAHWEGQLEKPALRPG